MNRLGLGLLACAVLLPAREPASATGRSEDTADRCLDVLGLPLRESVELVGWEEVTRRAHEAMCDSSSSSSGFGVNIPIPVGEGQPLQLGVDFDEEARSRFCRESDDFQNRQAHLLLVEHTVNTTLASQVVEAWRSCMEDRRRSLIVRVDEVRPGQPFTVRYRYSRLAAQPFALWLREPPRVVGSNLECENIPPTRHPIGDQEDSFSCRIARGSALIQLFAVNPRNRQELVGSASVLVSAPCGGRGQPTCDFGPPCHDDLSAVDRICRSCPNAPAAPAPRVAYRRHHHVGWNLFKAEDVTYSGGTACPNGQTRTSLESNLLSSHGSCSATWANGNPHSCAYRARLTAPQSRRSECLVQVWSQPPAPPAPPRDAQCPPQ